MAAEPPMYLHVLHFRSPQELSWAMGRLLDSSWVEDCLAEPQALRIRFRAPTSAAADLLERIYRQGGLTWATRHLPGAGPRFPRGA
jgi:hypothetical protein